MFLKNEAMLSIVDGEFKLLTEEVCNTCKNRRSYSTVVLTDCRYCHIKYCSHKLGNTTTCKTCCIKCV